MAGNTRDQRKLLSCVGPGHCSKDATPVIKQSYLSELSTQSPKGRLGPSSHADSYSGFHTLGSTPCRPHMWVRSTGTRPRKFLEMSFIAQVAETSETNLQNLKNVGGISEKVLKNLSSQISPQVSSCSMLGIEKGISPPLFRKHLNYVNIFRRGTNTLI